MAGETTFAKIKYSEAADEVVHFPAEVSAPGAKTIDKYLEEHTLTLKKRAASYEAVSGELALQESASKTTTLPLAATASQLIGVWAAVETKITTSGGAKIYGDFISAVATITLAAEQHILLFSDGTNWRIIAGEPKREQKYGGLTSYTKAEAETGVEASTTRPAFVQFNEVPPNLEVGGVPILSLVQGGSLLIPPGQKWKGTGLAKTQTLLL